MSLAEAWLPIEGYEGLYEVSDSGRVRRIPKTFSHPAGYVLNGVKSLGYRRVNLNKAGIGKNHYVHSLVARAFIGPRPIGDYTVNHINGDKLDNSPRNLEYVTRAENLIHGRDVIKTMRPPRGREIWTAKLTEDDVREIRRLRASGQTLVSIAKQYGVYHSCIIKVTRRKSWAHVI